MTGPSREMTLEEYLAALPKSHRAAKEYAELRAGARPSLTSPALKEIVERMRALVQENPGMGAEEDDVVAWADEIERAASLTAREQAFFEAAKEFVSHPAGPDDRERIIRMEEAYRALLKESNE